jgi:DNA-binding transcriptional LysR family regulator
MARDDNLEPCTGVFDSQAPDERLMRFDLSDLRLFVNVAERASISLGASATRISAGAASERIKHMEMELGTALLVREKAGVRPTAVGTALLKHARIILAQSETMKGDLAEFSQGVRGRIRLLSNTAGLSEVLPALVARYLINNQNVDLEVEERQSHEIIDAIRNGERDAGIVADFAPAGDLELVPLAVDQLVLVVHKNHPFASRRQIEFSRAISGELVGLLQSGALTEHLEMQAARLGMQIRWRVQVPNFLSVCGMVSLGVAPGIVSESAARRAAKTMPLKVLKLTDPWARRVLNLCTRRVVDRPPYLKRFIAHVSEVSQRPK